MKPISHITSTTTNAAAAVPDAAALLTAAQVRAVAQIGETLLAQLEKRGLLIPVRIGRVVRYKRSDVEAFISSLSAKNS
jgi:hypothetical protein